MTKIEPSGENGLSKISSADAFQIRSVSQERFVERLGEVSEEVMDEIAEALAIALKIL
jgi:mRNA interferase MazF